MPEGLKALPYVIASRLSRMPRVYRVCLASIAYVGDGLQAVPRRAAATLSTTRRALAVMTS
jgi:hypothetical protein